MIEPQKIELFKNLFETRRDVYAVQYSKSDGSVGYYPVKREDGKYRQPTIETYRDHLIGKRAIGVYQPIPQNNSPPVTPFVSLDLNREKFAFKEETQDILRKLVQLRRVNEVPVCVEVSRSRNEYPLWILFETPVEAWKGRNTATRLVEIARVDRATCKIWPKQDWLDETRHELGNLTALPLDGWGSCSQVSCRVQKKAQK